MAQQVPTGQEMGGGAVTTSGEGADNQAEQHQSLQSTPGSGPTVVWQGGHAAAPGGRCRLATEGHDGHLSTESRDLAVLKT